MNTAPVRRHEAGARHEAPAAGDRPGVSKLSGSEFEWTPNPYLVDVVSRADGSLILNPRRRLDVYPARLGDELERWAMQTPDRLFVARRGANGEWVKVTYAETLRRVQRIAAGLIQRNLSAERPIAILSGNSIEHLLLALAAAWAGIPYCPLSPAYAHASDDLAKLRYVFELLTPGLIVAFDTRAFVRALEVLAPAQLEIVGDPAILIGERPVTSLCSLEAEPSDALAAAHERTDADSIVKFLMTSGSTGRPKAVITTNRMLCSNAVMLREALPFVADEPPVLVDWLPWNHVFGGSHNVGLVLFNGGALYIDDGKPTAAGIAETVRNLREISPTVYFNVPKGFDLLAQHLKQDAQLRRTFFARVRTLFFGGASLSQPTWDALDAVSMQERGVRTPMLAGLGATETGPSVTFTTPEAGRSNVIGLPAGGCVIKLAPVEEKLELRVRSSSVTPGYWRQPELTAEAFDEEGYYRLGDAVRLIDPQNPMRGLMFDGRLAEDFKLGSGTWVSVGPLRAQVLSALAPLAQDVVIAGLNRDFLAALIIPDVRACASVLNLETEPDLEQLAAKHELLGLVRTRLEDFAKKHPGGSTCIRRARLLASPLDLDRGEITDKGYVNQRAVLANRTADVDALYAVEPPDDVVRVF